MFLHLSVILLTGEGVCMVKAGHVWWRGGMHGEGGVHGEGGMHGEGGVHGKGGMCGKGGHAWQRGGMCGKGGHAWYGRSMCGRYASYWNAYLYIKYSSFPTHQFENEYIHWNGDNTMDI